MNENDQSQVESDTLWSFIEDCHYNCNDFHKVQSDLFPLYTDIDAMFYDMRKVSCDRTTELTLPMFLGRAHAAYLSAFYLSISGLVPECFMLIRGCIENALYALYVHRTPSMQQIWLDREKDEDAKNTCRNSFTYRKALKALEDEDASLKKTIHDIYQDSIDCGAHPNVAGHLATSQVTDWGCNVSLFDPTSKHSEHSLSMILQAGVYGLRVFALIYGGRLQATGILDRLEQFLRRIGINP